MIIISSKPNTHKLTHWINQASKRIEDAHARLREAAKGNDTEAYEDALKAFMEAGRAKREMLGSIG